MKTTALRSRMMAAVPQKHSVPELTVRRMLFSMGYRYRLNVRELPGSPDIVLPRHRAAIFVHGCFWHRHTCRKATTPKANHRFWMHKFAANVERDALRLRQLQQCGWRVLVVWECELTREAQLSKRLRSFMTRRGRSSRRAAI